MKQIINTIAIIAIILLTGCTTATQLKSKPNTKAAIELTVNVSLKAFASKFSTLEEYGQNYFTLKGSVNGVNTDIHFYHGSYHGWTPKNLPTKGMIIACHSAHQPKQLHARMVLLTHHRVRLIPMSTHGSKVVFSVIAAPHTPAQYKQVRADELVYKDSLVPMGTITIQ